MYSFPNLEPVPCSMSGSKCCFLTCIQISQEAGKMVWYSHLFKNVPQFVVIYTAKGFNVVNEAEVFLELSCFFYDPTDVGNLISCSSVFSKSSMYIWTFLYCWALAWRILIITLLAYAVSLVAQLRLTLYMWNECNCMLAWTLFGIAFLWDWNENWSFPVLWPLLSFPNLLTYWMQHFNSFIF